MLVGLGSTASRSSWIRRRNAKEEKRGAMLCAKSFGKELGKSPPSAHSKVQETTALNMAPLFSSLAFRLLIQLLLLAVLPNPTSIFASKPLGFSIDLIHRDSSLSPLYDPSITLAQRAEQAALRSMLRSSRINSRFANTTSMISSPVMPGSVEYLMKLSLGTPSRLYGATLDTGSDLIWTSCCPCNSCSSQTSMFDPLQSSTYKSQSCTASFCMKLARHGCTINQLCGFRYSYGDRSFIEGILATETLLFDNGAGTVELPGIVFGCVHNEGAPIPALLEVPGLVGLGGGPLSIGSSIDKKFAYCVPPDSNENNSMGQLKFARRQSFQARKRFK
ncbi:putative aspartic protease [Nymphaea thermarum]|nr:putative aspartic protease [Nymphaea thermarum]